MLQDQSNPDHSTLLSLEPLRQIRKIVKFKVVIVMMFSSLIGMLIVPKALLSIQKISTGIIGISLSACASAALNHIFDQNEDKKMRRTQNRPLATAKLSPTTASWFAMGSISLSTLLLWQFNNPLSALLTLATTLGYSILYTKWLKPTTPQNIVIGGLSGAMPPLLGWASLTGQISSEPLILVLIIFSWTPAHFWPLAIAHQGDYAKTKWPMLPVTHGIPFTKLSIFAYTALTVACTLLPFCVRMTGYFYLITSSLLNLRWLMLCKQFWQNTEKALDLFTFSIYYLIIILCLILIDHHHLIPHV